MKQCKSKSFFRMQSVDHFILHRSTGGVGTKKMKGFGGVTVAADGVTCCGGLNGGEAMSLTPLTPSQYGYPTAYRSGR